MKALLAITAAVVVFGGSQTHAQSQRASSDDYVCNHGSAADRQTVDACNRLHGGNAENEGPIPNQEAAKLPAADVPSATDAPDPATFLQGRSDRRRYEAWYSSLSGDYLAGAAYWATNRSSAIHAPCDGAGSRSLSPAWSDGCAAAQQQLLAPDARRHSSLEYRRGWNSVRTTTAPSVGAIGASAPSPIAGTAAPPNANPAGAIFGFLVLAILLGVPVLLLWRLGASTRRARTAFWVVAHEHREALARQFLKLVQPNAYGVPDKRKWERELKEFYRTRMFPELVARGVKPALVASTIAGYEVALDQFAEQSARELISGLAFNPKMSPLEFEQFCASILERNGWRTNLTPGSGDQGADIIARRNAEILVVQCKLYTGPVGNKAVQEAHTAKVHMGASRAAVVTNAEFTPQAQQLAATTGTALLHYTQLSTL